MATRKSHYETLGVDKTAAELKRARRRKAEQSHPDKQGGSEQEMAQINHAFDVLNDPLRRQLYDATGKDNLPPEAEAVRGLCMQAFMDGLVKDAPDTLKHARGFLDDARAKVKKQIADGKRAVQALRDRRDKITTKEPVNTFHLIVDQQIAKIEQTIAKLDNDVLMRDKALAELRKYQSTEKPEIVVSSWASLAGTNSSSWQS